MATVVTFGFYYGAPNEFDVMFDARGIVNPHKNKKLRPLDGRSVDIQQYVMTDSKARAIVRAIVEFVKANPEDVVAIGCRWGKHRSVAIAEQVKAAVDFVPGKSLVEVVHMDVEEEDEAKDPRELATVTAEGQADYEAE